MQHALPPAPAAAAVDLGVADLAGEETPLADRSTKAWVGFGFVGAITLNLVYYVSFLPLGLAHSLTFESLLRTSCLTGLWCGLVGVVLALNLPEQWRAYRVRKLR